MPAIIFPMISSGTATALWVRMNPRAEALKKRTFAFGLRIVRFCRTLRTTWEGREFADQLFRAGTRVGANYRSACRGRSRADFVAKLGFVVEEADETLYWLEMIAASDVAGGEELTWLPQEASELCAIFNQSQITAKANFKGKGAREYSKFVNS
jgi:four helix bundle protein